MCFWPVFLREPAACTVLNGSFTWGTGVDFDVPPIPHGHYVYSISLPNEGHEFQRVRNTSRILYVGQGNRARIRGLLTGGHPAWRAAQRVFWVHPPAATTIPLQIRFRRCEPSTQTASKLWERISLNELAFQHGETPPCNSKWEGYYIGHLFHAIVGEGPRGTDTQKSRQAPYDTPIGNPTASWRDVFDDGTQSEPLFSLGWFWTNNWLSEGTTPPDEALRGHLVLLEPRQRQEDEDAADVLLAPRWHLMRVTHDRVDASALDLHDAAALEVFVNRALRAISLADDNFRPGLKRVKYVLNELSNPE